MVLILLGGLCTALHDPGGGNAGRLHLLAFCSLRDPWFEWVFGAGGF